MKQTLRKKIRKAIEDVLKQQAIFCSDGLENESPYQEKYDELAGLIADSVISVYEDKPAFSAKSADPLWGLFHGEGIEQSQLDREKLEKEALDNFESCLQLPDSWHWYSSGTDEKALVILREHVVKEYEKDRTIFMKYQTWRSSPYARGAMSNVSIKRNPENFVYSWTDFLASYAMTESRLPKVEVSTDENDTPITY